jgi:hypothetical protein
MYVMAVIDLIRPVGNTNRREGKTQTFGYTRGGTRCLGGVNIPTNILDIPEVGTGVYEE